MIPCLQRRVQMVQTRPALFFAACLLAFAVETTRAQFLGQLAGVVRDTTGGLLPGVAVTITGAPLAAPKTIVTNDRGRYEFDTLPAGRYLVEAALSGFEPRITRVDIGARPATLDLVLAIGSLSETVTVTATKTGAAEIHATPIAVTVLPARTLQQLGVQTVEGLAGFVPTLTVSSDGGRPQVTICVRGENGRTWERV
jgi:hypothetical protein